MPFPGHFRLSLIQKMIISFALCGICMMAALIYAVTGLGSMHRMEEEIARSDLSAATITITLREMMLTQERYVGKFQILRQAEFHELYDQNAEKFRSELASLQRVYRGKGGDKLVAAYAAYANLTKRVFSGREVDAGAMKQATARVEDLIEQIRVEQKESLANKLKVSDEKEAKTVTRSIGLAFVGVLFAFLVAVYLIYTFASSIGKLQTATHRIAAGDFDHDPGIPPGDEIGTLAQDFTRMAARLKELEQISLDASPLTRLPGNIAIERSISRRLRERQPFAMCYLDLDNFKSYNDRYGYIKASEILRETGELIHNAVKRLHDPEAFVGHIGGDDFVVIVAAELAKSACQTIIQEFDAMVPFFYSDEDRAAGSFEGVDRYGVPRVFPLISMSIAVLVCEPGDYATAAEIATAAAEVKDHVKESSGSNYIIVREAGNYDV
ncbi:sensor domain-containing diguanylate cyclase [Oryzomonas rubra]|uniref:diguanylate cyclase n=1 Tax=Oryzomonas rubra TaxID=2509454 RepID=A0A5A9XQD8_9BACT|nr:diguanylate cyclase [Oryzomonas rubra]KAA0895030.1 sensor domain-containing diguanylate cyclase [Oryzomonas rubra]